MCAFGRPGFDDKTHERGAITRYNGGVPNKKNATKKKRTEQLNQLPYRIIQARGRVGLHISSKNAPMSPLHSFAELICTDLPVSQCTDRDGSAPTGGRTVAGSLITLAILFM